MGPDDPPSNSASDKPAVVDAASDVSVEPPVVLTVDEAAELGPLLRNLTAALRTAVGCEKTYVALFAEAEGFQHVHFHVIPRMGDLNPDLRGRRIFGLLGGDPSSFVPETVMDRLAVQLTGLLMSTGTTR